MASRTFFYSHAALRGGIHPIVNGAEGDLRASAGVHRVEIMNERFHRLIGGAVRLFHSAAQREFLRTLYDGVVELIASFSSFASAPDSRYHLQAWVLDRSPL